MTTPQEEPGYDVPVYSPYDLIGMALLKLSVILDDSIEEGVLEIRDKNGA